MNLPLSRLIMDGKGRADVVNLKLDPEEVYAVREMYASILPAYHMNKRHWVSVILDGSVPQDFCELLIEKSYSATQSGRKRKKTENTV